MGHLPKFCTRPLSFQLFCFIFLHSSGLHGIRLLVPPSHCSPIPLDPTYWSPIRYWNSLIPHPIGPSLTGSPSHCPPPPPPPPLSISHPIVGQSQWSPISLVHHLIGSPSHWSPNSSASHFIGPPISIHAPPIPLVPYLIRPLDSLVPHLIGHAM